MFFKRKKMTKQRIKLIILAVFAGLTLFGSKQFLQTQTVSAKPAFMDRYNRDPFAREDLKTKCTICHIGRGGGERNDFGEAFEDAGYRFTPKLRGKFPQMFNLPLKKDEPTPSPSPTPTPKKKKS